MYTKAIAVLWAGVADLAKVIPVGIIASAVPPVAKHRHCWKSESRVEDGEQVQVGAKGTGIVNQHSTSEFYQPDQPAIRPQFGTT